MEAYTLPPEHLTLVLEMQLKWFASAKLLAERDVKLLYRDGAAGVCQLRFHGTAELIPIE